MVSKSLQCYLHTCYESELKEYFSTGQMLLDKHPNIFNDEEKREISTRDDEGRMQQVMDLYETGEIEYSTKLLCDMGYDFGDYSEILPILEKHYSQLKWDWALALCELRTG